MTTAHPPVQFLTERQPEAGTRRPYPLLLGVAWGAVYGFVCGLIIGIATGTMIMPGLGTVIGLIGAFITAPFVGAFCGIAVGVSVWIAPDAEEAQQYSALLITAVSLLVPLAAVMATSGDPRAFPAIAFATVHLLTFAYWANHEMIELMYEGNDVARNRWYAPSRKATLTTGAITGAALSASIWLFCWQTQQ